MVTPESMRVFQLAFQHAIITLVFQGANAAADAGGGGSGSVTGGGESGGKATVPKTGAMQVEVIGAAQLQQVLVSNITRGSTVLAFRLVEIRKSQAS